MKKILILLGILATNIGYPLSIFAATPNVTLNIEKWIRTDGGASGIVLSPDNSRLYVAYWGHDGVSPIEEYSVSSGKKLSHFPYNDRHNHGDAVLSHNGRYLYTTHYYYTHASRLDLSRNGIELNSEIGGKRSAVWARHIGISPNNEIVVIGLGCDGRNYDMKNDQISLMDISKGLFKLMGEVKLPDELTGQNIAFSSDSRFAYVTTRPKASDTSKLYEISLFRPFRITRTLSFPGGTPESIAIYDPSGKIFVSDSMNKKVWVIDKALLKITSSIKLEGSSPGSLAISNSDGVLYAIAPKNRVLYAINPLSNAIIAKLRGLNRQAYDIEISSDGLRVFIAHRGEDGDICVVRKDGHKTQYSPPSLDMDTENIQQTNIMKRNEGEIVFSSDREGSFQIYKMNIATLQVQQLTHNNTDNMVPRWSPDGQRIAFISDRNGPVELYVMEADGSGTRRIGKADPTFGGVPLDWSPDGRKLVFINANHTAIRTISVNGTGLRNLLSGEIGNGYSYFGGVSWRWKNNILFNVQNPSWGYDQDIFMLDTQTGNLSQLTNEKGKYAHSFHPALSPNGETIAVCRQPRKDPPPRGIYLMRGTGRILRKLTEWKNSEEAPRWSPDGDQIVFASGSSEKKHILIINNDGTGLNQLTHGDSVNIHPDMRDVNSLIPLTEYVAIDHKPNQQENLAALTNNLKSRRHIALLIGIDEYQHTTKLRNAVADTKAIEKSLRERYGFDVLSLYNEQATHSNIYITIRKLVASLNEGDNVLIYYAGHGWEDEVLKEGYWIPVDAKQESEYISNAELHKYINAMEKAQHVFLVADSCFSGSFLTRKIGYRTIEVRPQKGVNNTSILSDFFRKMDNRKSRVVLTSGTNEPVPDGGREGHSIFGYYFLRALNSPDDLVFTASELVNRVQKVVANNSSQTPITGNLKSAGHEDGGMIFINR